MHQHHSPARSSKPSTRRDRVTRLRAQSLSKEHGSQPPPSQKIAGRPASRPQCDTHSLSVFARHDQPQQRRVNATTNPGDMSQMLPQPDFMMDMSNSLSLGELDHTANSHDPIFSPQETPGVFGFPDSLQSTNAISNQQLSTNIGIMTDLAGTMLSDEIGIPPNPANGYYCSNCCYFNNGSNSFTSTRAKAPPRKTESLSLEESLESVAESVQDAGFKDMDEMILSYYTAIFDEDSDMFHEQRMSRKRGLPTILSALRNSTASWNAYEREGYQTQILKNAESLLVDECQRLFASPAFKERLAGFRSGAVHTTSSSHSTSSTASNPSAAYSYSSVSSISSLSSRGDSILGSIKSSPATYSSCSGQKGSPDLRYWLPEELPNVWKLVSSLSGCRAGSQPVATVLLAICLAHNLPADEVRVLLQSVAV